MNYTILTKFDNFLCNITLHSYMVSSWSCVAKQHNFNINTQQPIYS